MRKTIGSGRSCVHWGFLVVSRDSMEDLKNFDDPRDKRKCGLYARDEKIDNDTMPPSCCSLTCGTSSNATLSQV